MQDKHIILITVAVCVGTIGIATAVIFSGRSDPPVVVPAPETVMSKPTPPPAPLASTDSVRPTIPLDVRYSVIKTSAVPSTKRSLDIRINKIVSEDVLRAIALKLKAEDLRDYPRTFMLYYLPDMTPGGGAWASTHFDPELDVRILGFTDEQAAEVIAAPPRTQKVIGRWVDNAPGVSSQITIYREIDQLHLDRKFQDGSSVKLTVVEKPSPMGRRFQDVTGSDNDDHFVITTSGDLEIRDGSGVIATAKAAE